MVHSDRVPMTPNFGQQPRLIVTIQPAGARFDPPARLTLPNVEGLAPGEVTDLYSFDHDLGHFVSIGPGTVSEDGSLLVSNPGVGIVKAGWHCGGNPTGTGTAHDCPKCKKCNGSDCPDDPDQNGDSCGEIPGEVCHDGDCLCAVPINFHQTDVVEVSPGHLKFTYSWGSNTGDVEDLDHCMICEKVTFQADTYPPPFPPVTVENPTLKCVPGTANVSSDGSSGTAFDSNPETDVLKPGDFLKPYFEKHFPATQKFFYTCPCKTRSDVGIAIPVTVLGPLTIDQDITQRPDGKFKFTVTKSGTSSSIDPLP